MLAVEAELTEEAQRVMADAGEPAHRLGLAFDERLRLVLLCAHPALTPESAAALSLRMVMGVATEDIARLFLVWTPTMAARLTRARKRLAAESFDLPAGSALDDRLALAADVAYLAFTAGYAPRQGLRRAPPGRGRRGDPACAGAARRRARGRSSVELDSLLALMLLQHSRRDARVDVGGLVLLPDQDRARWHAGEIAEALALLTPWVHAPGTPYLLQALIAAEHAVAPSAEGTDWSRIAQHYRHLEDLRAPRSSGSTVPSPSRRPMDRTPGSRCSTASSWPDTAFPAPADSCCSRPAVSRRAAPSWPAPSSCAATRRSEPTSGGC